MSYIEHAKREFLALGYKPIDQEEDGPNKWIQEAALALLEVHAKQGHSGFSNEFAVDYFSKLAKFEPLCPLSGDDSEWSDCGDGDTWQNIRCSHVFKNKKGVAYDIDGYVFWHWCEMPLEEGEEGYPGVRKYKSSFTSNYSRIQVTFPYTPKSPTYVEVECFEVNKQGQREVCTEDWETIYPMWIIQAKDNLQEMMK